MKYFIKTILCATRPNKKIWIFLLLVVSGYLKGYAQENGLLPETPVFGVKTNLLYDATATINLGVETKLNQQWTLDLSVNYNPWTFKDEKSGVTCWFSRKRVIGFAKPLTAHL